LRAPRRCPVGSGLLPCAHRNPEVDGVESRASESTWQNTNDAEGHIVHNERFANRRPLTAVLPLPEIVVEHDDLRSALRLILLCREHSTEAGTDAQQREEVRRRGSAYRRRSADAASNDGA